MCRLREFARNVGLSQMFVIRTPSLTMDSTNITDNVLSAFVMDVEFVASSFRGLSSTFSLAVIVAQPRDSRRSRRQNPRCLRTASR